MGSAHTGDVQYSKLVRGVVNTSYFVSDFRFQSGILCHYYRCWRVVHCTILAMDIIPRGSKLACVCRGRRGDSRRSRLKSGTLWSRLHGTTSESTAPLFYVCDERHDSMYTWRLEWGIGRS